MEEAMTGLEIGLLTALVAFVLFILFKCKLLGHAWLEFVHGRNCVWCNKYERNGEWVPGS